MTGRTPQTKIQKMAQKSGRKIDFRENGAERDKNGQKDDSWGKWRTFEKFLIFRLSPGNFSKKSKNGNFGRVRENPTRNPARIRTFCKILREFLLNFFQGFFQ